jgi:tight adherence protein B
VDEEFRKRQRETARRSPLFKNLGEVATDPTAEDARPSPRQQFRTMVEQSGVGVSAERLLGIMAVAAVALGGLGVLIRRNLLVALVAAAAGAITPLLYVYLKRNTYLSKLLKQLPDAFELIARVLRAGQTIPQAMQAVADEFDAPIAAEFSYCYEQQKLGLPPEVALRDLARRSGLLEIKILVLAVIIQQQTGGNLAQLVENLASVVRDRLRIRDKVKALTGEGRMQAAVLLAMPPFMFVVMLFLRPSYAHELLARPNLMVGMAISMAFGALWIRKIINFEV